MGNPVPDKERLSSSDESNRRRRGLDANRCEFRQKYLNLTLLCHDSHSRHL